MLITIGGDDTAFSAMGSRKRRRAHSRGARAERRSTRLGLPPFVDTFATRREAPRRRDRQEPDGRRDDDVRWYFIIAHGAQGRALALGIGKSAGATLTLIPEEFGGRVHPPEDGWSTRSPGRSSSASATAAQGVAVIAEGLCSISTPQT